MRRTAGHPVAETVTDEELKICELCGALNLASNRQCCSCAWHGRFETRPEIVHTTLDLTLQHRGGLRMEDITDHINTPGDYAADQAGVIRRCFRTVRSWFFG